MLRNEKQTLANVNKFLTNIMLTNVSAILSFFQPPNRESLA